MDLTEIVADDLSPDASLTALSPLAMLLYRLCATGVLGPKPTAFSRPVPPELRCPLWHSPDTRVKSLRFVPGGVKPIRGFEGRCRKCGGLAQFTNRPHEWQRAGRMSSGAAGPSPLQLIRANAMMAQWREYYRIMDPTETVAAITRRGWPLGYTGRRDEKGELIFETPREHT